MDGYRATLAQQERSDGDTLGDDDALDDDDVDQDGPPASVGQEERRMQVRAYNHWTSLLGARNFPRIEDLASANIPDFAKNAVVLDFSGGIEDPAIAMLGERLADECGATQAIARLSDIPGRSLLSRITDHYRQILVNQAPVGFEAEFINLRNKTVVYRGILLPFSSDGKNIQHILGVMNWKELADPAMTAGLRHELDNAVAIAACQIDPPLGEWADGPTAGSGFAAETLSDGGLAAAGLADWHGSARQMVAAAKALDDQARAKLSAAIGQAWDFALAAQDEPAAFAAMMAAAGLKAQPRAPMMPLVKLVFGAAYDQSQLAEFAAVLTHARRQGLKRGELANYLAATPGGLKRVVSDERKLRKSRKAS